ncbi:MAG: hypothetical protein IIU25_04415 [Oscillospiraceae bacterium]|nr:hypothetical protein [Oscillospiraceae bacterium]MBQ4311071.1 hypothetical protein [Oscillospiraceae bacterium]MBQ5418239.1 hypothetical protein [Oscillospiraceae bacterium]
MKNSEMIKAMLELDREAVSKLEEAAVRKEKLISEADERAGRFAEEEAQKAESERKALEEAEKAKAEKELSRIGSEKQQELERLERIFAENAGTWAQDIYDAVLNGTGD